MLVEKTTSLPAHNYTTDHDVRWCPGCGNFAILKAVKSTLSELAFDPKQVVFISGIGCSGRFPYYVNTNGFHTIHGRALTIASGLKIARPDLTIFVVVGDGDTMSIGLSHFIHTIRRNLDINILLINNQVYGLTKGQSSPTTNPSLNNAKNLNSIKQKPLEPLSIAHVAGGNFLSRVIDVDMQGVSKLLKESVNYKGTSIIEIYQNCHIFNEGVFDSWRNKNKNTDQKIWFDAKEEGNNQTESLIIQNEPKAFGLLKYKENI